MKKSYTNIAIASAVAFAFGASSVGYSQTAVDQQITAPTSFAGNSTDLFAASAANTGGAVLNPSAAQAAVITTTYNAAVTQLNASSVTTGSAAAYQLAVNNFNSNPTPATQSALSIAQKAYNANIQTVNNLAVAATVVTGSNDTYNTFTGNPGDALTTDTNAASGGVSAGAVATANAASASIGTVTAYYADGGATTGTTANGGTSDLEGGVIAPIQALGTIAPAADDGATTPGSTPAMANNGFVDADEVAVVNANAALNAAAANYTAVINNPASTNAQVDAAALALNNAQTAYVGATNTLYTNFVPITQANKTALLGTVLNGSWERQALLNNANVTSTNTVAIGSNNTNIVSNGVVGSNNTVAIASNNTNIVSNGVVGSNNTVAIGSNNTNIVSNGVVGSNNTVAIASNNTNIVSNGVVGSNNTVAIGSNNTNIVSNGVVGSTNTVAIASNNTNIVSNGVVGSTNTVAIASNNTNIVSNGVVGSTNTVAIASNNTNIVSNGVVGSTNTVAIASNNTKIGSNATSIVSNNTNIGLNTNAIASNNTNIVSNNTKISQEIADRDALIRREADGIHIGTDSFIMDDVAFNHRLTTNSGDYLVLGGGANGTDVWVDGDLEVGGDANFQQDVTVVGDVFINGNPGVQAQLNANASQINKNKDDIDRNARGIAMVAALQHTTVLPGMSNALDVGAAHFEGETGMSLNYARRINENWQINFGAASTTDFDESVIKAGVGVQW